MTNSVWVNWDDPFLLENQLDETERMLRESAKSYASDQLAPRVTDAFSAESFDRGIMQEMGAHGLLGVTTPEDYGGLGTSYVSYGLVARELA